MKIKMSWKEYAKTIAAFVGVLFPFLDKVGVNLPPFLTVSWVEGLLLALTPAAVFYFANKPKDKEDEPKEKRPVTLPIIMLPLLMLGGCETLGYDDVDIDTTRKAIVVANAELSAANLLVADLVDRGAISPVTAQDALDELRAAHGKLQKALNAVETSGDPFMADDFRLQATRAIDIALQLLAPANGEPQ